ncbi:DUF87 domain-containing protein, partial [Patescibacteria group bacterium]|nr:DUF87 domain-containing protein [Patescibacteria group bacterium]
MSDLFLYLFLGFIAIIILAPLFWFFARRNKQQKILASLGYALYEIAFPYEKEDQAKSGHKEISSLMENFYSGMSLPAQAGAISSHFVLEIGLPYSGEEIVFYCAVPRKRKQLFEKQIQGLFPKAEVRERHGDFNIFKPEGFSLGSIMGLKKHFVLPIKTYDKFEVDPIQLIVNAFSKLKKEKEGAALQLIVWPAKEDISKKARSAIAKLREGKSAYDALRGEKSFFEEIIEMIFHSSSGAKDKKEIKPVDEELIKLLEAKASKYSMSANIRLLVSADTQDKAEAILSELESVFLQFNETNGNSFYFYRLRGRSLKNLFYNFIFRIPDLKKRIFLNVAELATIFHFPSRMDYFSAPQLKYVKTRESAPPGNLPERGLLLGKNIYRGDEKMVYMNDDDRRRHFYIIGQTGTGKSVLLKNMIVQDIQEGKGVCFIDPHGSDLQDILARIPKERIDDVIYFNPGDTSRPMGLNMLEYDPQYPEQKTFIVNELMGIFNKLFDMKTAGGPMFEQYFRNSTMLV